MSLQSGSKYQQLLTFRGIVFHILNTASCFWMNSVMPSNILIWLLPSQLKTVPNGWKFTFSRHSSHPHSTTPTAIHGGNLASLQPSYPFCLHLDRRWASWINLTIRLVLKPYLPVCPFSSITIFTNLTKLWASSECFCNSFLTLCSLHSPITLILSIFLVYLPSCLQS